MRPCETSVELQGLVRFALPGSENHLADAAILRQLLRFSHLRKLEPLADRYEKQSSWHILAELFQSL